ncbi:unnamed protein product, partial [Hapterophycus canaliculatus]
ACLRFDWRLSDLDEDGSLSLQEFEIAFHLIFCATQRGLDVPDELPQSMCPAGYVPPSILARRKVEAERKHQEEKEERRRREALVASTAGTARETSSDAVAETDAAKNKKKKKREKKGGAARRGDRATSTVASNEKSSAKEEGDQRKEIAAREVASRQKKEEMAKKRAEKAAKSKNNSRRPKKSVSGGATTYRKIRSAPTPIATAGAAANPQKKEGTMKAGGATEKASPRTAASNSPSLIGGLDVADTEKAEPGPASASVTPPSVAETADVDCNRNDRETPAEGEIAEAVPPFTMADRRARKAEARAARIEAALLKKETAARDARLKELDLQDGSKKFTMKMMDPMETSQDSGALHMLSDLGEDGGKTNGRGALSFARLSAPLPHLTPYPGRTPCLRLQEFSVSFPSGARRASSLTSSLELRLGPPKVLLQSTAGEGGRKDSDKGTSDEDLLRCPECADLLKSAQMVGHTRSTCRLLPCTLCSCLLLPADRERHLHETCPNRRRGCTRCGEEVILSEFARHEKEGGCVHRAVNCAACGEYCCADDLRGHQGKECPERDVHCPSCGDVLPARCMAEHASSLCRSISWMCGCGEGPFPLSSRPNHLKSCDAFIDAWEASIEKVVMISTRVEDPGIMLLALAESGGNASLAARKVTDDRAYVDELCLAAGIVNVGLFLKVLKMPGKRGSGSLWRAGL